MREQKVVEGSDTNDLLRVELYNKKYTVIQSKDGRLRALRYDKEWRDCVGDGLVLALAQEIVELRKLLSELGVANGQVGKIR